MVRVGGWVVEKSRFVARIKVGLGHPGLLADKFTDALFYLDTSVVDICPSMNTIVGQLVAEYRTSLVIIQSTQC